MDKFKVETIAATPNPQQVIWAAMHQDYSEDFVWDRRDKFPDESRAGELIVKHLLAGDRGHYGCLEHPQITLNVGYFPHSMMQQLRTHRVGISFDVQCLAGDTEVTFVNASGSLRKIEIAALYDLWSNGERAVRDRKIRGRKGELPGPYRRDCKTRLKKMRLRVLNEETGFFQIGHLKDVMCSGVQPVYRLSLADGKILDCTTNHRLLTSKGWQRMGDALGLITDDDRRVLAVTSACELMCNGVLRYDAVYTQKNWFVAQIERGLTAKEIAESCGVSVDVIRYWAKQHQLKLPSRRLKGLKTVVGDGLYRDKNWLEARLAENLHADQMAELAGCSVESIKKWIYAYGLTLNRRSPGSALPWNKGHKGYNLNLSEESREQRREKARKYTKRGLDSNFWKGGTSTKRELIGAWTRQVAPQIHEKYGYRCQRCGQSGVELHAHHLVPVYADESLGYSLDNLVSLCKGCHQYIHQNNLEAEFAREFKPLVNPEQWHAKPFPRSHKLSAHPVAVVGVEYLGLQTTYDLEVEGDWHNFVANGVVVHNSFRYTGQRIIDVATGKREIEDVFYLRPTGKYTDRQGKHYHYTEAQRSQDLDCCLQACQHYQKRLEEGLAEEHARGLIPFDARQHFVLSCNARSLMHLLDLRWKKDAQLEAQKFCELLYLRFEEWCPAIAHWYKENRAKKAKLSP